MGADGQEHHYRLRNSTLSQLVDLILLLKYSYNLVVDGGGETPAVIVTCNI